METGHSDRLNTAMKVLAIIVLLATVLGAGLVLYGMKTLTPQVEFVRAEVTEAAQVRETFDSTLTKVGNRTFTGHVFSDTQDLDIETCAFLTYTLRLRNRGFFPAEWIMLSVEPKIEEDNRDVLELPEDSARVLPAFSRGDLTATVLHTGNVQDTARTLRVVCYVLGREITFDVQAE